VEYGKSVTVHRETEEMGVWLTKQAQQTRQLPCSNSNAYFWKLGKNEQGNGNPAFKILCMRHLTANAWIKISESHGFSGLREQ